jgi:hypothetical protein
MIIPGFLEPVVQYYTIYGPFLIMVTLILAITYTFISNFASVRSAYTCTSLKNVLNGSVGKCFGSRIGSTCRKSDIGYTHGWCNDADNYGPLRGTRTGPYAVKCSDWIWSKGDCPPDTCDKIAGKEWGWCADKGVQRAMRGQACGPFQGSCDTWIWNAKACPQQCGAPSCKDDSCICTMLKARYVIIKRYDNKNEYINLKQIEVYDSNGYKIKGIRPTLWPSYQDIYGPQQVISGKSFAHTDKNKNAYIQLDLGEDKSIGRVVITNRSDCCKDRVVGCALIVRKNDNSIAFYRKITEVKDVYDIPIGKAKPIVPATSVKPTKPAVTVAAAIVGTAPVKAQTSQATPTPSASPWKQIQGNLKHISVDPAWTWGVNGNNEIYKCKTPCNTAAWSKVEGSLIQVDVGSKDVWGVNSGNDIYRRPKDGSGKWTRVKGQLKYVSSGPTGSVWGVNAKDDIYMCTSRKNVKCTDKWQRIDGKLKQLSVGSEEVWGVNGSDDIYKRPVDGSGNWKQVSGKLKHVSVGADEIIGVNSSNDIYTCKQPCNGNWSKIEGKLRQVDTANSSNTVGVNDASNIYMRV